MADSLELEESELFDVEPELDAPSKDSKSLLDPQEQLKIASPAAAAETSDDETDFILENENGIDAAATPVDQPDDVALRAAELGTSSEVGSLKRFDSTSSAVLMAAAAAAHQPRPFGSEGDLELAASVPTKAFAMPTRKSSGQIIEAAQANYLGTSMPIRIPMMQRRCQSGTSPGSIDRPATFIPPHLLDGNNVDPLSTTGGSLALSPSAAVKREKLMARNAILRSTGFIEIQSFAAPVGEVIDAVKESIQPTVATEGLPKRHRPTSSLSALLGSST